MPRFVRSTLSAIGAAALLSAAAYGQTSGFSGFTAGNLVVSRSVYAGDATTVIKGQAMPPVCPSTAKCGTGVASDNGAYPSTTSSNNVWNNDNVDGSFGITAPIFLDQMTPAGTLVNSLPVPSSLIVSSFSSKSELALNLSTDGTAITFMGYVAPPNTIDVSNSNTPMVYDPTNPAGGSYFRAVAQVGANGAIQITKTNAYNGNNGRSAIMANGLYYIAGNSNNGSGTPANVVAAGGVQVATPGQAATTLPTQVGNFSIAQITDPTTGQPYAADKLGKDNNYRGITVFNNTLYVTKGSGSNGINTVYQVGAAGTLPTLAAAAAAPLAILPGFPTSLAKTATAASDYPFGIWFANATTLYVADEGDGTAADAAGSTTAGLQKWILTSGTWKMAYVLQNGLNLGQPYSVANYPASLNPATDGLRNIAGKVNGDGTVTIWAVTSTVSSNGDQGADPNQLVSIADVLANTTASGAASEKFTIVRTANVGEVLRGVCLAPTAGTTPMTNVPSIVSAATWSAPTIAPGELVTAFGQNLSAGTPDEIFGPLPTLYYGNSVSIVDSASKTWPAPLAFVSPNQLTFEVPSGVAAGSATVNFVSSGGTQTANNIQVAAVSPALFTLNGSSLAAAETIRVSASGAQTYGTTYQTTAGASLAASPINMGSATDQVYLVLYATGMDAASATNVQVTVGGVNCMVEYSGSQGLFTGLDQINVLLPASLAGKGTVEVQLTANGVAANAAQIVIM
jgi:uncharacterized protein (TIGR03437 family)